MVRWQGVMWRRLTLTLLLASIASSSSSRSNESGNSNSDSKTKSSRDNSGSSCPESCRCTRIQPIGESPDNSSIIDSSIVSSRKITEVHCVGRTPEFLTRESQRLVVEGAKPQEVISMLLEVEARSSGNNNNNNTTSVDNEPTSGRRVTDQPAASNKLDLRELVFINCSLRLLNVSLRTLSESEFGTSLNLSVNQFEETGALSVGGGGDRLTRLDISNNRLVTVRNEAFANFAKLALLNLRRNRIESVHEGSFLGLARLESLDLSDNRLTTLDDGVFVPLCLLQKLDLSGNKLVGVLGGGHQWFDGLGRLKELDVSRNGRTTGVNNSKGSSRHSLGDRASSKVENRVGGGEGGKSLVALEALPIGLKILRLAENPLTDVELSLVLGSGRRLETVDASRIGLERVPSALTRSVRALTLSGNRITSISSGDFDSYPLLRLLDLSSNVIDSVEEDAFGRLENLEILDLSINRLIEIPQSLPNSLLHLVLSRNRIERLTAKDLQGVYKLNKLVIDNNAIREIELGSMSQLGLLAELDISGNPIKQLPANTFGGPRSLVSVRMSDLTSLEWDREKRADMAFPVPAPEGLVTLDLSRSPALAAQLLADEAALSACKSLRRLDLARNNLTSLRSDLAYLLPQLHTLGLSDNPWNCTRANSEEILWLAEWIKQHEEIQPPGKCAMENLQTNSTSGDHTEVLLSQLSSHFLGLEPATTEPTSTFSTFQEHRYSSSIQSALKDEPTSTPMETEMSILDTTEEQDNATTLMQHLSIRQESNIVDDIDSSLVTSGSFPTGNGNVTKVEASIEVNDYSTSTSEMKDSNSNSSQSARLSINSTDLRNELGGRNEYSSNTSEGSAWRNDLGDFESNPESSNDTLAEELIGREESAKSLSRTSEIAPATAFGAHPGLLVIGGAVLGAVVALSVVLSRRVGLGTRSSMQSVILLNRESYHRQENIEVHSLAHQQQPQPIFNHLW